MRKNTSIKEIVISTVCAYTAAAALLYGYARIYDNIFDSNHFPRYTTSFGGKSLLEFDYEPRIEIEGNRGRLTEFYRELRDKGVSLSACSIR